MTEELREQFIEFITNYKDVAERNALAETPTESADYLLSLLKEWLKQNGFRRVIL